MDDGGRSHWNSVELTKEEEREECKEEGRGGGDAVGHHHDGRDDDDKILGFLDSLDSYLSLVDALCSNLRQGWLELASARHSMGSSRISSVLLDHKVQSAATTLQVIESVDESPSEVKPHFVLSKWMNSNERISSEAEVDGEQRKSGNTELRHRGTSGLTDVGHGNSISSGASKGSIGSNAQKERSKSLSVFGGLVSPKLRAAQISFESALDGIVEIANIRTSMLSSYSRLREAKSNDDVVSCSCPKLCSDMLGG